MQCLQEKWWLASIIICQTHIIYLNHIEIDCHQTFSENLKYIILSIGAAVPAKPNGLADLLAEHGGMVPMGQGRIVGGYATTIEAFPWIVTIQLYGSHHCGGSIISATRLLTAAHCTQDTPVSSLQIRAGSTDSQAGGEFVQVTNIIEHPLYNRLTLENDVSILWIPALNLAPAGVATIGLPAQHAPVPTGALAHVAGWGALCWNCPGTNMLRYVSVPIVSNAACNAYFGGGVAPSMLCAGFSHGEQDACRQGDSGGPLNLGAELIGIVSWGEQCALPPFPGVYARVAFFRNWIDSNM